MEGRKTLTNYWLVQSFKWYVWLFFSKSRLIGLQYLIYTVFWELKKYMWLKRDKSTELEIVEYDKCFDLYMTFDS